MSKQAAVILFTGFYVLGITAFILHLLLPFIILLLTAAVYMLFFKKIIPEKYIFIFLSAFALGVINTGINIKYDDELSPFADRDIKAEAEVISIPSNNISDRTKFYAEIKSAKTGEKEINNARIKALVTINDETKKISEIKIGDKLELKGRLKKPAAAQNPSQFDYAQYLRHKKTFSLLYVNSDWKIISRADNLKGKILSSLNDARSKILKIHAENVKSPMLEILGGIIFGDDAVNPDEETKTSFVNSGIFHILAASGMNVTLIFGIWYFAASRLRVNYKLSVLSGMVLILVYTFMTGFGAPIIRAAIMLMLILAGRLIGRNTNTMSLLFAAGFIMLAANPLMLFDTGFQMSFIVTFSLILTAPLINFKFKYRWVNNTLGACAVPAIAQFYAAPLQLFYFNTFTLYSVFANIAVIPVLSVISFLGFISSIAALIPYTAHQVCFAADTVLNPLLVYVVKTAEFFSNLPSSIIILKKPSVFQIVFYYALITGIICAAKYKIRNAETRAAAAAVFLIFISSFIHIPDKNLEIIYFSAGNADSFLAKSPDNKYFMIDTAKTGYAGSAPAAENIMIKYMRDNGIKSLDALILSHYDSDHAGGACSIIKNINVKKLYVSDSYEDTSLYETIKKCVKENNIDEEIITGEKEIYNKNGFVLTLIKPEGDLIQTENQKSLAAHIGYKGRNFLFAGDGDINSYNALPDKFKKNITVMKSGHHGALNTVNEEMADNSEIFILSTGFNVYNHPHPETIKTIEAAGKKYYRTDRHNAVRAAASDNKTSIELYSPYKKKFENIRLQNALNDAHK